MSPLISRVRGAAPCSRGVFIRQWAAFVLIAAVFAGGSAWAQLCPIPFSEDAEGFVTGPLAGQGSEWTIDEGDPQVVPTAGAGGSAAIDANGDDLCVLLNGDGETIVWTDFRIKPKALPSSADPVPAGDTAVAFFFTMEGELKVLDGTTWVVAVAGIDLEGLHRITTRADYTAQVWAIWLDGVEAGADLGFANPVAAPVKFRSNRAARVLDDVRIHTFPLADGYAAWQGGHSWAGSGTGGEVLVDSDRDGFENLLEYAFASNPLSGASCFRPTLQKTGDSMWLTFRWNRAATDCVYRLKGSSDMQTWETIDPDQVFVTPSSDGVSDEISLRKDFSGTPYFLQINVERPSGS